MMHTGSTVMRVLAVRQSLHRRRTRIEIEHGAKPRMTRERG